MTAIRAVVAGLAFSVIAGAQQPMPQLTLVAPAAPGGGWDQTARVMQQVLRETGLAGAVQVVNTPGAAGTIGLARFVTSERGNGATLLVTGLVMVSGIVTNHSPVTLADATPVARLSGEYEVIVVPKSSPFKTLADLVTAFRASPRSVSWGGGSAGGTDEILARLIAGAVGVPLEGVNYIAYSGGGQALAAVLGAHVSAGVSGYGEFAAQIESGDLRALAISAPQRVDRLAIPTLIEQGVNVSLLNWRGVVAPPGLSRSERNAITELTRRMAESPAWKAALIRNGWADLYMEGDRFDRFIKDEAARVTPLVSTAGKRGTDWFEWFVFVTLAVAVVAVVLEARAKRVAAPPETNARTSHLAVGTLVLGLAVDAALINTIGFIPASAVLFTLTARAFGSKRVARDAIIGLALSAVIQFGFTRGLGVNLPFGFFG